MAMLVNTRVNIRSNRKPCSFKQHFNALSMPCLPTQRRFMDKHC